MDTEKKPDEQANVAMRRLQRRRLLVLGGQG